MLFVVWTLDSFVLSFLSVIVCFSSANSSSFELSFSVVEEILHRLAIDQD